MGYKVNTKTPLSIDFSFHSLQMILSIFNSGINKNDQFIIWDFSRWRKLIVRNLSSPQFFSCTVNYKSECDGGKWSDDLKNFAEKIKCNFSIVWWEARDMCWLIWRCAYFVWNPHNAKNTQTDFEIYFLFGFNQYKIWILIWEPVWVWARNANLRARYKKGNSHISLAAECMGKERVRVCKSER